VTALDAEGDLDVGNHRHNVRTLWERSVRGFVLAGSTGEGPYLEPGERETLCMATRDELAGDPFLVCGIAAETIRAARSQLEEAAAGEADMVLVMTPTTLVRGRHHLVEGYFREVADISPLPVLLYTVPGVTGYELPVESVVSLAGHDNVVGIKDSGGDPERFAQWAGSVPEGFLGFCGTSRAILASMAAGAHGAITASANYAFDLVTRCVGGDAEAQAELTAAAAAVESDGVAGTKAAAARAGLRPGPPRAPLLPVDEEAAVLRDAAGGSPSSGVSAR
ncbi:MAG: dihydrodipicolinate synthase family protein, partial [Actinobacteria bacterium]